ncbi:MAG: sensor histidine kinase [Bacteroidota bacterium]|nr:sensor histidine kinase [Bacteroidota bacterium]
MISNKSNDSFHIQYRSNDQQTIISQNSFCRTFKKLLRAPLLFLLLILPWIPNTPLAYAQNKPLPPGHYFNRHVNPDTTVVSSLLNAAATAIDNYDIPPENLNGAFTQSNRLIFLSDSLHLTSWKYKALQLMGDYYLRKSDLKNAQHFYGMVTDHYNRINDKANEATTWFDLGITTPNWAVGGPVLKLAAFNSAERLYMQLHKNLDVIKCMKEIADVHLNQGKIDLSEQELLDVLKRFRQIHYNSLQGTYDLLAIGAALKGDLEKELYYRQETVRYMQESKDFTYALRYYGSLGKIYMDLKNYKLSRYYIAKGLATTKPDHSIVYMGETYNYLSDLIREGKGQEALLKLIEATKGYHPANVVMKTELLQMFGDCYVTVNKYKTAQRYSDSALSLLHFGYRSNQMTMPMFFGGTLIGVELYIKTKDFKKARHYLEWLHPLPSPGILDPITVSYYEHDAFKIDSAYKNYLPAIAHYKHYIALKDSLYSISKTKQIEFRLETEKKNKNIQLQAKNIQLLKKQSQLQQTQAGRRKAELNFILTTAVILLLLLGITYRAYHTKRSNNLLLKKKQAEIEVKNTSLQRLLSENEWLLKEIHHRVKNNLQMITGLLNSQSVYLKDPVALEAIMESQRRVQSMALIHQKLYKTTNYSTIYMPDYIQELVVYLKGSFEKSCSIRFHLDISAISLDIANAIPVGLIVNEALTNSIKYAFPASGENLIEISLHEVSDELCLVVSDNGKGLPADFGLSRNSFGTLLMKGLTNEMSGTFEINGEQGTKIKINFRPLLLSQSLHIA